MQTETLLPDLQSCVLCEDVRCEFNGMQTLVGVLNIVPTPKLPINYLRLCIWTRWCSGSGPFHQRSRMIGPDDAQTVAQAEVDFELKEMEGHATNVHYFGGVQFQQFGLHHVEFILPTSPSCVSLPGFRSNRPDFVLTFNAMANTILVGAQWGDEGKGKIIDFLTENADIVVRRRAATTPGTPSSSAARNTSCTSSRRGILRPRKDVRDRQRRRHRSGRARGEIDGLLRRR